MLLELLTSAAQVVFVDESRYEVASITHIELHELLPIIHLIHNRTNDLDGERLAHDRKTCHLANSTVSQR